MTHFRQAVTTTAVFQYHAPSTNGLYAIWREAVEVCKSGWYAWLDFCEEMEFAMTFYSQWRRRHQD